MARKQLSVSLLLAVLLAGCASSSRLPAQRVDDFGVPMARVPAGEFTAAESFEAGAKTGERTVYLDDFYLDVYEVTNRRYAECVAEGVCAEPENTKLFREDAYLDHPVVFVTYDMAQTYCRWRGGRLPGKAEWEKGAGAELAAFDPYWGDLSPVCQVGSRLGAGIDERSGYTAVTQPAGSSGPNAFGLYDMTGGVWEWVDDRDADGEHLGSPATVSFLRIASWSGYGPVYRRFVCGFRCAGTP